MKTIMNSCALLLVAGLMAAPAFAHGGKNKGPCAPVWKACVKAGKKSKDAKQCVATIKGGGTVEGVTVDENDLKACQGGAAGEAKPAGN